MHREVIEQICTLEQRIDTQSLRYGDVNYWPVCRLRIWSSLINRALGISTESGAAGLAADPNFKDVGHIAVRPAGTLNTGLIATNSVSDGEISRDGLLTPDLLLFVRHEEYRDRVNNIPFAKMLDSIYERAQGYRCLKVELADPKAMGFDRFHHSLFFHAELAARSASFDPPYQLEHFEAVDAAVRDVVVVQGISEHSLATDMGKIFYWARLFEVLLSSAKPKAVMLSVYYHPVGMALMLAASRLGIPTADVQHGRLGPHHGLYTQLTAAPPEGYALLPDLIWCWGEQTKYDIEVDKAASCTKHGGLVGGNPWLDRWRLADTPTEDSGLEALTENAANRKFILVSLQTSETPLPQILLAAMAAAPDDWVWWLRLHPHRRHTSNDVKALLNEHGIRNFEIDLATDAPLYGILRACDHHVTAFSTVALEALAFDKSTTLVGETGREIFLEYIETGVFSIATSAHGILVEISRALESLAPRQINRPFIETKSGLAESALATLLQQRDDKNHGNHQGT